MPGMKPLVRASVLNGFEKFLSARNANAAALYDNAGLPPPSACDGDTNLPVNGVVRLMELAAGELKDPCVGLSWAKAYPIGGTGILYYLFMNAVTVGDSLKTVARYAVILRQPFTVQYEEDGDGATLWWRWPESIARPYTQYNTFAMALLLSRLRMVTGPDWSPVSVELQCETLNCQLKPRQLFGANISYLSDRNAVRVCRATVNRPMPKADPMLRPVLQMLGEKLIAEVPPVGDLVAEVKDAILDLLPDSRATLDDVAARLEFSSRQLQNQLAQAGTTFERVISDTLRTRAELLLVATDLSLTEISELLGFSELSAFTRAGQRWFGMPPSSYRQQVKKS